MKIELKLIVGILFSCFLISSHANAQQGYWEKAEAKYQSDYRQRIADNMNMKPGKVAVPASNGISPEYFKTKTQKAADAAYMVEVRKANAAAYQREADRERDHENYLQSIAREKAEQKRVFIENGLKQLSGSTMFSKVETVVFMQDLFYLDYAGTKSANQPDYLTASKYVMKFIRAAPETSLDTLINYVWKSQLFPDFAAKKVQEMQLKFSQNREALERLELYIMPYYFGASTKYATAAVGYTYPLCAFELMNDEQKIKLLDRFEDLEYLHPEVAKKMAADCRIGFNVFYKYATSNLALKNKTSAKRLEYLYNTLATEQANLILPKGGLDDAAWKLLADQLLRGAGNELKLIYPGFVEDLSSDRWLEIAKASKLSVKYIAWAFRDEKDELNYLKKLPNLSSALKDEYKAPEDGVASITLKNRDRYVGALKNGKPNGIGKYTSTFGDTYEGFFKDGYLHGKGKSYAAKDIKDDGDIFICEGDEYTGDFDKGARHGNGTLINLIRSNYKYVGGFVNGKKEGEGEESSKSDNYKGHFKNGRYNGFGIYTDDKGMYTGNFKDGSYDGKGVLKYTDGSTLEGKWVSGIIEGKATLTSANGYVLKYVNDIEKKLINGKGSGYSRTITTKNLKYYSPYGKEISEAEYNSKK
ncbi:MAG: hypothetical protein ABIT96_06615 [Ferruginibacter sp.]